MLGIKLTGVDLYNNGPIYSVEIPFFYVWIVLYGALYGVLF